MIILCFEAESLGIFTDDLQTEIRAKREDILLIRDP